MTPFRYATLATPIVLLPGVTYTVGGFTGSGADSFEDLVSNFATAANVNFSRAVLAINQPGLSQPTTDEHLLDPGLFGGSFVLQPVPEPPSIALLGGWVLLSLFSAWFVREKTLSGRRSF